jgi:hypothetical protein
MEQNSLGITAALIFLGLLLSVMIGLIIYAIKKMNTRNEEFALRAQQRGWKYLPWTQQYFYQIHGSTRGIAWRVLADVDNHPEHRGTSNQTITWTTDDIFVPHLELILVTPEKYKLLTSVPIRAVSAAMINIMTAVTGFKSEHDDLLRNGQRMHFPQSPLKEMYIILARDKSLPPRLFDSRVQDCLLRWQNSPTLNHAAKSGLRIDLGQNNLRVYTMDVPDHFEEIELLVELGCAVALSYQKLFPKNQ